MEGQDLLSLVKGRNYNAELRAELAKFGLRRISSSQWISKATANKYELVLTGDGDEKTVSGVDVVEKDQRIHLMDVNEMPAIADGLANANIAVHHKTLGAIRRQIAVTYSFIDLIDRWNAEIDMNTPKGQELKKLTGGKFLNWYDFLFLPDPLASGDYLFGNIQYGKAASIHSWLDLPDGSYLVPTDGTDEGAQRSLECGLKFHAMEREQFATAAAAGQYAIKALNNSKTTYATAIKKLLGKENGSISRNDFYRNEKGEMCRIVVSRTDAGMAVTDVPVMPTVAECIDSLLSPFIKARAFETIGNEEGY
ncbi:MAG: hypothetical protein IKX25_02635 [Bacteroidales bacterium]|nr:hypothetical protein [Bacteroidales bacterium]